MSDMNGEVRRERTYDGKEKNKWMINVDMMIEQTT